MDNFKCPHCGENIDIKDILKHDEALKKEFDLKLNENLKIELNNKLKSVNTAHELQLKEKDIEYEKLIKQLNVLQKQVHNKQSTTIGEAQEICIYDFLRQNFDTDIINEVSNGKKGADISQIVINSEGYECGEILYESKRAVTFQSNWITKFKEDIINQGSDFGVLITKSFPKSRKNTLPYFENDILICSYTDFKSLACLLRKHIAITFSKEKNQPNNTKKDLLFEYINSNQFLFEFKAITDTVKQQDILLEKERKSIEKIWKKRQLHIDQLFKKTASIEDSINEITIDSTADDIDFSFGIEDLDEDLNNYTIDPKYVAKKSKL